jgi:hypothetical protein
MRAAPALPFLAATLVALLVALALPVHAGTADAPEITDPTGDAAVCAQSPACTPSQDSVDLTAAWISETADGKIVFNLAVKAAPPASGAGAGSNTPVGFCAQLATYFEYDFNFLTTDAAGKALVPADPGGNTLTALFLRAVLHCDTPSAASPTGFEFDLAYTYDSATGSNIVVIPVDGALAGNVFSWTVDRSDPLLQVPAGAAADGFKIDGLSAVSGVAGSFVALSLNTIVADTAPDSGFGTPYTFGGSAAAKGSAIYENITTPTFNLVAKNPKASNGTYVYNWTASGSALGLTYALDSSQGTAHVVVRDAANATVFDQSLSAKQNGTKALADAKQGAWVVTVTYSNFTGDLTLGIAPSASGASSSSSSSASSATASSSSASSSSSGSSSTGFKLQKTKKSPGLAPVASLLVVAFAAIVVRRRLL